MCIVHIADQSMSLKFKYYEVAVKLHLKNHCGWSSVTYEGRNHIVSLILLYCNKTL